MVSDTDQSHGYKSRMAMQPNFNVELVHILGAHTMIFLNPRHPICIQNENHNMQFGVFHNFLSIFLTIFRLFFTFFLY